MLEHAADAELQTTDLRQATHAPDATVAGILRAGFAEIIEHGVTVVGPEGNGAITLPLLRPPACFPQRRPHHRGRRVLNTSGARAPRPQNAGPAESTLIDRPLMAGLLCWGLTVPLRGATAHHAGAPVVPTGEALRWVSLDHPTTAATALWAANTLHWIGDAPSAEAVEASVIGTLTLDPTWTAPPRYGALMLGALGAVEAGRRVAAREEREQVAAGTAAEVEDARGGRRIDRIEQRLDVLGDVVVARSFPEAVGVGVVVGEGGTTGSRGGVVFQAISSSCGTA